MCLDIIIMSNKLITDNSIVSIELYGQIYVASDTL